MPSGRRGANIAELDTLLLAMNDNTSQTEYAWEFMKLLSGDERIQSEIFTYSEGVSVIRDVTEADKTLQLLIDSSGDDNGLNLSVLSSAVENAVVTPKFRNSKEAVAEVDKAVRDIMEGSSNISMEQIIWNREINNFLKNRLER